MKITTKIAEASKHLSGVAYYVEDAVAEMEIQPRNTATKSNPGRYAGTIGDHRIIAANPESISETDGRRK